MMILLHKIVLKTCIITSILIGSWSVWSLVAKRFTWVECLLERLSTLFGGAIKSAVIGHKPIGEEMKYTLVIIDMQSNFEASNNPVTIAACQREIEKAVKDRAPVVLV